MSKKNSGQGAGYVGKGVRGSPEEGKTRERMWLRPPVQTHSVGGAGGHAIREIPQGFGKACYSLCRPQVMPKRNFSGGDSNYHVFSRSSTHRNREALRRPGSHACY